MHGRFRQRLVALIDELLDDPPPPGESFLLDGQAVVIEDYLGVRPERRPELAALLQTGQLEAGPWYVLADELIPSGEALVRNLLVGRRILGALGAAAPPVLYCPDAFGHPAALPELASGFGLPLIIAWRGFGSRRWPAGDTFQWQAPSGAQATLHHLPRAGYEFGSALPPDLAGARERWARMRDELAPRSATGVWLLQNGADHHARQRRYRQALTALEQAAGRDARVQGSTLRRFAEDLLDAASSVSIPVVAGELRDSYGYTWTLQGTFATRAHEKRANVHAERALLREAEPFAALARARGGSSRRPLVTAAWRTLLEAHPHDTLCGCSVDEVARAMEVRVADALTQARGIAEDSILDLVEHGREEARGRRSEWIPAVVLRNPAPRARGGIAIVTLDDFLADVPVGPGSGAAMAGPPELPSPTVVPGITGARLVQVLGETEAVHDRTESPRHYPDDDLVARRRVAIWVDPVPAYAVSMLPRDPSADRTLERVVFVDMRPDEQREQAANAPSASTNASTAAPGLPFARPATAFDRGQHGVALHNGHVRLLIRDGVVSLEEIASGRRTNDILLLEDLADCGDLYTPSLRGGGLRPELHQAEVVHRGPLVATVRAHWRLFDVDLRVAASLAIDLTLHADSPVLHIDVRGENAHRDHRLRVGLRSGIERPDVWADAAFGTVARTPVVVSSDDAAMEQPPPTAPLHRYVSLFSADRGATVFSDGLAEYEATRDGVVFVTLLRAVGELSRNDLPERPGHAGWPAHTPLAQALGPFEASLALVLHGPRSDRTIDLVERLADDVLVPFTGDTLRSALRISAPVTGAELSGEGLAFSALKESEDDGTIVARCVNLLEHEVDGAWRFGFAVREAHRARLDETPLEPLDVAKDRVAFRAGPREVVTILVRPR